MTTSVLSPKAVVLTLTTPKTIVATQVRLNSILPDLVDSNIKVNCSLLDANNNVVGTANVVIPFSSVEGGWVGGTGSVTATIGKLVLAALA